MGLIHRRKTKFKSEDNTGFGTNASSYGGRFLNKDGSANIEKRGIPFFEQISWFHSLLRIPRWKFQLIILSVFVAVNLVFASLYYLLGVEHLSGIVANTEIEKFGQAFFFSAQTFTTVGYGHISPKGFLVSSIAAVEALSGLLGLALATGLLYGRFSKPRAYIKFSENALIAPYKDGTAFMFRLTPYKNTNLSDTEVKLTLGMVDEENGAKVNKFYNLDLEISKINALSLSWTLVHNITEESPFYGLNEEDYKKIKGEILVYFHAFDEMFSANVLVRNSYLFDEIVYGAKFIPMFDMSTDKTKTVLHIDKLNLFEKIQI
ncbi:MAG: ion channel [Limnohabitans sp.]|nr:ion channel [Limnohabitans sp.]